MSNVTTFNDCILTFLKKYKPEKTIMIYNDRPITMGELNRNIDLYARHLIHMGVKPGTGIGYTLPNRPEIMYLFLALARLGAYALPVFHMIPDAGKVNIFKSGRVQWVITSAAQYDALSAASVNATPEYKLATIDACEKADYNLAEPADMAIVTEDYLLKQTAPHLPLLMSTSSGTTGIPKPVMMTQGNGGALALATIDMVAPDPLIGEDSYTSASSFPFSTSGILTVAATLFGSQILIFSDDISPMNFLRMISKSQAVSMAAPPAYFEALLSQPMLDEVDTSSIKRIFTGMDFLSPAQVARLKAKFININSAVSGYGLVETTLIFMHCKILEAEKLNTPLNYMKLIENIGNSIDVRDADGKSVVDGEVGELYVKGPSVVPGYLGNPAENAVSFKDGWFKTGDIVRKEGANVITLLGRQKYLIKRGGRSVSPLVVQNQINTLNGVKNSAVVGIPHPLYGEMIWAFVVKNGNASVELKDIRNHCRLDLPVYMIPDQVTFIDEIPKNSGVGKVNYEKMKQLAQEELKLIEGGKEHV